MAWLLVLTLSAAAHADVRVIVGRPRPASPDARSLRRETAALRADLDGWLAHRRARAVEPRELWIAGAVAVTVPEALVPELERAFVVERDEVVRLAEPRAGRAVGDTAEWTYGLLQLRIPEVRRVFGLTGRNVRVGVIDSGADGAHPDLAGKVERFRDLVNGNAHAYDDNGHGTHCAGTIAGGAASGRAIGVAPGVRLTICKAFDAHGAAGKERLLAAMQYIADPDGDPATHDQPAVCSCSWFGGGSRKFLYEATRAWVAARILPVFAQGNTGPGPSTTWIPGGYLESFAVGAVDQRDRIAEFSSRGPIFWDGVAHVKPDVVAPGESITSAMPGGGYQALSGTSMATPHVAGAAALLFEAEPALTLGQLREALEGTAVELGEPGKDNSYGSGRLDLFRALQSISR